MRDYPQGVGTRQETRKIFARGYVVGASSALGRQALDEADIDRPAAMTRMRSHLLRRMKIVLGEEGVRDLLITEFILQ